MSNYNKTIKGASTLNVKDLISVDDAKLWVEGASTLIFTGGLHVKGTCKIHVEGASTLRIEGAIIHKATGIVEGVSTGIVVGTVRSDDVSTSGGSTWRVN